MLKKTFLIIAIIVVAGYVTNTTSGFANLQAKFEYSVCDRPIYYKIGQVDEKFGLKKEKLLSSVNRAAQLWNKEAGRDLFLYSVDDPKNRAMTINFKYDKRQALTTQINQLEGKVYKDENSLKAGIKDYEDKVAAFNARLEKFNQEVHEWNQKGGAPPEVYEGLRDTQAKLQEEAVSLEALADSLNGSVNNYNSQIGSLNNTIESFNSELSRRPEEGLYDANENKIEIFFFADQEELLHTLAHEFGHARGLEHIPDDRAIMSPYTTSVLKLSDKDREELAKVCTERNTLDTVVKIGKMTLDRYKQVFENFTEGTTL